jgi:hypothetical protein
MKNSRATFLALALASAVGVVSIGAARAAPIGPWTGALGLQSDPMLPLLRVQNVQKTIGVAPARGAAPRGVVAPANRSAGGQRFGNGGQRFNGGGGGGQRVYNGGGQRYYGDGGRRGGIDPGAAVAIGVIGGIIGAAAEQQAEDRARREYEAERRYQRQRYYRD